MMFYPDFTSSSMDLTRSGAVPDVVDDDVPDSSGLQNKIQDVCLSIDKLAEDLKKKLEETNEQLLYGVEKFTTRYEKLKESIPLLSSAFHCFGWTFGGSISSQKGGHLRHGRRIAVQAGRRKGNKSRGKAKATPARSATSAKGSQSFEVCSQYHMPTRRALKGRRPHSLGHNIDKGQQNAGKW